MSPCSASRWVAGIEEKEFLGIRTYDPGLHPASLRSLISPCDTHLREYISYCHLFFLQKAD